MNELNLTYYGVVYSKKNSKRIITNRRTFKPMIISNRNAKNQEISMAWDFATQARDQKWHVLQEEPEQVSNCQFKVAIEIYQKDYRRRDLDNQATAILDGLVASGVLPDDSCDFVSDLHVMYKGIDKENPRAEITIKEVMWKT